MKKQTRLGVLVLLSSSMVFASCQKDNPTLSSVDSTSSIAPISTTGEYMVKDGVSNYSIVVPAEHDENVTFAASELQNFLVQSTGVKLSIITDDGMAYNPAERHFSLGTTSLFTSSGYKIPEELLQTGYVLKRQENTLFLNAVQGTGIIDGVYDFLEYVIHLKVYSYDEFYYDKVAEIPLYDFQAEYKPLFDTRDILAKHLIVSTLYKRRLRLYSELGSGKWAAFSHTVISIFLPLETYYDKHHDWYSAGKNQVCYSNDEMREEMVARMKDIIIGHAEATYIQIGHEDNLDMCMCDKCVEARKKLGGFGGQELDFTNKVEAEIDPWLHANYPNRSMKYVFFAYQTSAKPPLKTTTDANGNESYVTDANGNYVPFVDNLVINPNVMVMFAPVDSNFSLPFTDPANAPQYTELKGWGDLFKAAGREGGLYVWTYSIPVYGLMVPMNNFGAYGEQYHTMADLGVGALLDQSATQSGVPCFEALKFYTQSQLMYNRSLSYNDLVKDFIAHYYGAAGKAMQEFYDLLIAYYAYLTKTMNFGAHIGDDLYEKQFWNFGILKDFIAKIDEGIDAIQTMKSSDSSRYELLESRLRREECFPIYVIFLLFMDDLSQAQKEAYWEILNTYTKKYDIIASRESGIDIDLTVEKWRVEIFG